MADKLLFKRGLFENLSKATKVPGTLYVTTDEQAIYYDVSAEKRVRLSQSVVQVESAKTAQPPFSTEALYYFVSENALMKWNGTDWKQLNSTAAINELIGTKDDDAEKDTAFGRIAKAQAAAEAAQTIADSKTTMAEVEAKDYATKIEAQGYANAKDTAIAEAKGVGTAAQTAAEAAQAAAEAADAKADLKAPIEHSSTENIYGLGTSEKFGHVKLSDVTNGESSVSDGVAATPKAVKAAYDAATAAQKAADDAQTAANDNANAITTINGTLTTHGADIENLKAALGDDSGSIGSDVTDLKERMTAVEGVNTAQTADIADLATTVDNNKTVTDNAITDIHTAICQKTDDTDTSIYGYINTQKAASDSALTSAKSELQTAIDAKASASEFADFKTNVSGTYATKADLSTTETTLTNTINEKINAANAMTYKGTIAAAADLPASGVSVGDTYVATTDMTIGEVAVYVGDLLVAKGIEEDNIITSNLDWDVVATGYNSTKDPKLAIADNTVTLQNAANGSLGAVTFAAAEGSSLTVTTSENTITYSLEWGEF